MINVNQQALLELLKASLFGEKPYFPEDVDWDAVLQEAKDQAVVALAAPAVLEQESAKWQSSVARNTANFLNLLNEQTKLIQLFDANGIPLVILKGFAAAMYYPTPLRRSMGDIDFIVPSEHFERARVILDENGYEYKKDYGDDRDYRYTMHGVVFELHHRYSDKNWDIEPLICEGFSDIAIQELYHHSFSVFPTMINGLILLDHIRHHLYVGLGIRQIIDWMMFVHTSLNNDSVWKNNFLPIVHEAGLETFAVTVTKMCKLWFGLPDDITWCDSAENDTAEQLMEMVFDFGNFGVKGLAEQHSVESMMMDISRYGLFGFLQKAGESNWKAYHRHRFLRPFAWLYQSFRLVFKGVSALFRGERNKLESDHATKTVQFHKKLGINYYNDLCNQKRK